MVLVHSPGESIFHSFSPNNRIAEVLLSGKSGTEASMCGASCGARGGHAPQSADSDDEGAPSVTARAVE